MSGFTAAQPQWTWDSTRAEYYYWDHQSNLYHYQSGLQVSPDGSQLPAWPTSHAQVDSSQPRATVPLAGVQSAPLIAYAPGRVSTEHSTNYAHDSLSRAFYQLSVGSDANYRPAQSYIPNQQGHNSQSSSSRQERPAQEVVGVPPASVQRRPSRQITDPSLYQQGVRAHAYLRGAGVSAGKLDKRYVKRRQPGRFFVFGKVFKILWAEPIGDAKPSNVTVVTNATFSDEQFIAKIRWFVVVKEGKNSCSCLPIHTYTGLGVGKESVVRHHHAPIYTENCPPVILPKEEPPEGEPGMMEPIMVVPTSGPAGNRPKMDPVSRVDFGKIYTVEHNMKVLDFGDVHKDYHRRLKVQWQKVLMEDEDEESESDDDE